MSYNFKDHWENIYKTKSEDEVSWFQKKPNKSIELIKSLELESNSKIIDVGSGESRLVDNLIILGFKNITLLDISLNSLEKSKVRLGSEANLINWINSDIILFNPTESYNLWHDRATFHFLKESSSINKYVELASNAIKSGGYLIISTFSKNGPLKCSGLEIKQYDKSLMISLFSKYFDLISSEKNEHDTPFNTKQEFIFNLLKRK
jgi:ubiquinone/menaquinone biosynthesis C-methylase UbiE